MYTTLFIFFLGCLYVYLWLLQRLCIYILMRLFYFSDSLFILLFNYYYICVTLFLGLFLFVSLFVCVTINLWIYDPFSIVSMGYGWDFVIELVSYYELGLWWFILIFNVSDWLFVYLCINVFFLSVFISVFLFLCSYV